MGDGKEVADVGRSETTDAESTNTKSSEKAEEKTESDQKTPQEIQAAQEIKETPVETKNSFRGYIGKNIKWIFIYIMIGSLALAALIAIVAVLLNTWNDYVLWP